MELCEEAIVLSIKSCDEQYFVNKTLVEQRLRIIDETLNHVPKVSCDGDSYFRKTIENPVDDVSKLSNQTTRSVTDKTNINDTNAQTKNISKLGEKVNAARTDIFFKKENEEENNMSAQHYTSITHQEIPDCRTEIKEDDEILMNYQAPPVLDGMVLKNFQAPAYQEVISGSEFSFSMLLPELLGSASSIFAESNTKGCHWFPDQEKILVSCEDARYRIFDINPEKWEEDMIPSLVIKETEMIYDHCWAGGGMFLSTGRYQPVHLWSGNTGQLQASYKCFNHLDEITHAFSLALDPSGEKFIAGLKNQIRTFDLSQPGRNCEINVTGDKNGRGQVGIISCLSSNSDLGIYAAGSYSKTVGVYSMTGTRLCLLAGHTGGVTQVSFSKDDRRLYSGGRKDDYILCWDLRNPGQVLHHLKREVSTNQRIQFGFAGDCVISGGTDGCVRIWDAQGVALSGYLLHPDAVPGLSVHPSRPLIATAAGQRHTMTTGILDEPDCLKENSLKIWNFSRNRTEQ